MLVRGCAESELELIAAVKVEINDIPIALVRDSSGQYFAIGETCSHADFSLSEGEVDGDEIECWGHGAFDFRSGPALLLPAVDLIPVYRVEVSDGVVDVNAAVLAGAE